MQHLQPGAQLQNGKYIIHEVLGHGTFGITYSAIRRGKTESKVCIKEFFVNGVCSRSGSDTVTYSSETLPLQQCKEEFIAEAKNLIELNHPNIVKAYDQFEENDTCYYVMDYIEGENLNSYLRRTNVSIEEAIKIITRISYALSYMHESQHMLHLDLKPGNVMRRSSDDQIILIDFGLSQFFTEDGAQEKDVQVGLGTKGYAPVEQRDAGKRDKDFKATIDVYSLGAIFYKLITGETPLPAVEYQASPDKLHEKLMSAGVSEHIQSIVAKAMNPDSAQRYQSVMEFVYDLDKDERKRRNKGCLYTIIGVLVVILAIWTWNRIHEKQLRAATTDKEDYYHSLDDFVFEMQEFNQGANHYGEQNYYKFFDNGTGFYLFVAWHDKSECDGDCDLTAKTDTTSFTYTVSPKGISYPTMNGWIGNNVIPIDVQSHTISFEQGDTRYINPEKVNWDKVEQLFKH